LLLTSTFPLHAQNSTSRFTETTTTACSNDFAAAALVPLRGKMPMAIPISPTDEMRSEEMVPTAKERSALPAYFAAVRACSRLLVADLLGTPAGTQPLQKSLVLSEDERLLHGGRISYAEYFRRQDRHNKAMAEEFAKAQGLERHAYQDAVEAWLAPSKSNYPTDSLWWTFYSFAIERAREVDSGKISQEVAQNLIEVQRLKVNEQMAAQTAASMVSLNCEMTAGSNQAADIPLVLDYSSKQVNGYTATFGETTVSWSVGPSGNGPYNYQLNRFSGFLSIGNAQFPRLATGHCTPAKKKF
jgi:hypothetical protein